jgi:hypothetical protein
LAVRVTNAFAGNPAGIAGILEDTRKIPATASRRTPPFAGIAGICLVTSVAGVLKYLIFGGYAETDMGIFIETAFFHSFRHLGNSTVPGAKIKYFP